MKNKILLYQPIIDIPGAMTPPLALLAVGNSLLEEKYEVEIIDTNIRENAHEAVLSQCPEILFLGITTIMGTQIEDGANLTRKIQQRFPELPVVWGGWFPSVCYEQLLEENMADYVVVGQGETTIKELAAALKNGGDLEKIPGIAYKKDNRIVKTPFRSITDLNQLPLPSYDLVNAETYIIKEQSEGNDWLFRNIYKTIYGTKPENSRTLFLCSSYGCPNDCSFCCSPKVYRRRWKGLNGVDLAATVKRLQQKHDLGFIRFLDAEFFIDKKRVITFCRELLKHKVKISWDPTGACAKQLVSLSEGELSLLQEAGCITLLIGAESASLETLKKMKKPHTPEMVEEATARLLKHKIVPRLTFLVGTPGENEESILKTFDFASQLKLHHPSILVMILYFIPFPGVAFYEEAIKLGFVPPTSLVGWSDKNYHSTSKNRLTLSELNKKHLAMMENIKRFSSVISCDKATLGLSGKILKKICAFRLEHSLYRYPIDYWTLKVLNRLSFKSHKNISADSKISLQD